MPGNMLCKFSNALTTWRTINTVSQGPGSIATHTWLMCSGMQTEGALPFPTLRSDLFLTRSPHTVLLSHSRRPTLFAPFPPYFKDTLSIPLVFPSLPGLLQSCVPPRLPQSRPSLFRKALLQVVPEILLFQQNPNWQHRHRPDRTKAGSSVGLGKRTGQEDPSQQTQLLSYGSRRHPLFLEGGGTRGNPWLPSRTLYSRGKANYVRVDVQIIRKIMIFQIVKEIMQS